MSTRRSLVREFQERKSISFIIAMYASDTCNRPEQAESATVVFLNKAGFYDAPECTVTGVISGRSARLALRSNLIGL